MSRGFLCAAAFALGATCSAHAQTAPQRVISLNTCTDQHLLSLAEPAQIKGLSPYSRDPARSWFSADAARFPALSGGAEDALMLTPDLVVTGRFSSRQAQMLLRAHGVRVEEFDVAETVDQVKSEIARFGELVGGQEKARRQIAAIDAAVARARAASAKKPLTVLALQRRGWVSGARSLITPLMETVGLRNAAAEAGVAHGQLMSLEAIIAMRPDLLLVTRDDSVAEDQGRAMLLHPAIAKRYGPERIIVVPERMTVCGGVMLVDALDALTRQIERLPSQ